MRRALAAWMISILGFAACAAEGGQASGLSVFAGKTRQQSVEVLFDRIARLDNTHRERLACMRAFPFFMPEAEMLLREKSRSGRILDRQMAIRAYGYLGALARDVVFLDALQDEDPGVADNARAALAERAQFLPVADTVAGAMDEKAASPIRAANLGAAVDAWKAAPEAIRPHDSKVLARCAVQLLKSGDAQSIRAACEALSKVPVQDWMPDELYVALEEESRVPVIEAACGALAVRTDADEILSELCTHESPIVRLAAATALASRKVEAVDILKSLARDKSARIRAGAAAGLGRFGGAFSDAVLTELTRDPVWTVRAAAAEALGRLPGRAVNAGLTALASDERPEVRACAALAMHRKGVMGAERHFARLAADADARARLAALTVLPADLISRHRDAIIAMAEDRDTDVACAAIDRIATMRNDLAAEAALCKACLDSRLAVALTAQLHNPPPR